MNRAISNAVSAGETFAAEVLGLVITDEPTPEHHIRQIRQALLDYRVRIVVAQIPMLLLMTS